MAFKVYALQRLHAANFRGVAAVINSRPVIRTGPGVPPGFGLQPLGTARPKPAIFRLYQRLRVCLDGEVASPFGFRGRYGA